MIGVWRAFVDRMAHQEPATPLALFRIGLSLVLVHTLLSMAVHGVVELSWVGIDHGGYRSLNSSNWLVKLLGGTTPTAVWSLLWAGVIAGVFLALGLGGRVTAFVLLMVCVALFDIHPASGGGHDRLFTNGLWWLSLGRSTETLSLDCRIRRGRWTSVAAVPAWVRYLLIFQVTVVYCSTGAHKLGVEWMPLGNFSAVYYSLLLPSWQRFDMTWVAWAFPLTQLATALSWLWEISWFCVPLALYFRSSRSRGGRLRGLFNRWDVRRLYAVFGVAVHLTLLVFMDLGPFSLISLSYYACLWHHDEWVAMLRIRGA